MNRDREQVRLLGVFHFVVAACAALAALLPILHLLMGIGMVTGRFPGAEEQEGLRLFGWFLVVFAAFCILFGLTFAVCLAIAGRFLLQLRHRTYCLVLAGLACFFMPFGTVLGVFTLVVLMRDSVAALFEPP
jgi:hypothetical protein